LEDLRIEIEKTNVLTGKWIKITRSECSEIYPDNLEFKKDGTYLGIRKKSAFSWWDIGEYKIVEGNTLKISTANDSIQEYKFRIKENKIAFSDKNLCKFSYIRSTSYF